ncbi:MAG: fluoride efflux transporter CrcB [Crocinitomicaceae bacterium]|nr:fluoride efflux transporter CrcB [Crocinitomicaceae bacterium]
MNILLVFIGGGIGSVCRYAIGTYTRGLTGSLPAGTLFANTIAAIILGILAVFFLPKQQDHRLLFLLGTGFCGGLSTFSAFSLETVQLVQQGYSGIAVLHILLNLILSLGAIFLIFRMNS